MEDEDTLHHRAALKYSKDKNEPNVFGKRFMKDIDQYDLMYRSGIEFDSQREQMKAEERVKRYPYYFTDYNQQSNMDTEVKQDLPKIHIRKFHKRPKRETSSYSTLKVDSSDQLEDTESVDALEIEPIVEPYSNAHSAGNTKNLEPKSEADNQRILLNGVSDVYKWHLAGNPDVSCNYSAPLSSFFGSKMNSGDFNPMRFKQNFVSNIHKVIRK